MGAKQTRCANCKREGDKLMIPCRWRLRVRRGVVEQQCVPPHGNWEEVFRVSIEESNYPRPCPPKTTLQVWKWLGEQLPKAAVLQFAKSILEREGYEIED